MKILLVESSPRKAGNSEVIVDTLAAKFQEHEVKVLKLREEKCNFCLACGVCQGRTTEQEKMCVQKDAITELLPFIDECDAIVLASPIYYHQINAQGKMFIERMYPFFNFNCKNMSNTSKFGKKAALVLSCMGGPMEVYEPHAEFMVKDFAMVGAESFKSMVFNQLIAAGDIAKNEEYMKKIDSLADWLTA